MGEDFEAKVSRQVDRLSKQDYPSLEAEVAHDRIAWFERNRQDKSAPARPSPRDAYELLFVEYMGISEDEVPVLLETDTRIVWSSFNRCPTLEACVKLGLDTRQVCRAVYEKSTQALVSQLDPQLRFHRSYEEIRPHSHHCKEMIVRLDFERLMKIAIAEADASRASGNKGYGALIVWGEEVLARAHDTATTEKDPSLHAEVNAIRRATKALGDANLSGAVLLATCEPCPMCSSLAVWANVTAIVYGVSIDETARLGKSRIRISASDIVAKSPAMVEVIGGVLEDECRALYV